MKRALAIVAIVGVVASGCGGSSGDDDSSTPATDSYGNPLRAGEDWSGVGRGKGSGSDGGKGKTATSGRAGGTDGGAPDGESAVATTTIPYGCNPGDGDEPPPDAAGPLASSSSNDFPVKAVITPLEGDAGTEVSVDVTAVAAPEALVVIFASFYDKEDHGMRAAKFADAAGRARFKGQIPADAPLGWAAIAVSVTTEDQRSAIDIVNFVVTGPGCD